MAPVQPWSNSTHDRNSPYSTNAVSPAPTHEEAARPSASGVHGASPQVPPGDDAHTAANTHTPHAHLALDDPMDASSASTPVEPPSHGPSVILRIPATAMPNGRERTDSPATGAVGKRKRRSEYVATLRI